MFFVRVLFLQFFRFFWNSLLLLPLGLLLLLSRLWSTFMLYFRYLTGCVLLILIFYILRGLFDIRLEDLKRYFRWVFEAASSLNRALTFNFLRLDLIEHAVLPVRLKNRDLFPPLMLLWDFHLLLVPASYFKFRRRWAGR